MRRGATIFAKRDAGTGLVGVLRGSVKIGLMPADGREAVLNVVNAVEIFGEMALLDGRPRGADATAMSDCDLVSMDRATFVSALREQPDVSLKVIEFLCAQLRRTNEQVQDVMFLNAPARLAKTLLQLADNRERRAKITQRDISQIIGLSREMTNKQLRAWERTNWVRLERGGVVVLRAKLLANIAEKTDEAV